MLTPMESGAAELQQLTAASGIFSYIWIIIALPLAGAAFLLLAGRRTNKWGHYVAIAMVWASFALGLAMFFTMLGEPAEDRGVTQHLYTWFNVGGFTADVGFQLDQLSMIFVLLITGVGGLIHIYSVGYMADDPDRRKFFAYLNLFVAAMLLLVLADNFALLYFGWEGVGLASYLLVGFWQYKPSAAAAAKKAFVMNRVGDFGLALGVFLIFATFGTVAYPQVFAAAPEASTTVINIIGVLLLVGACAKSAQFPLHAWLFDAMEGPTPASALIHGATMVAAGTVVVGRLFPLYAESTDARLVLAVLAAATTVYTAVMAFTQNDVKKLLAYSTMSQVALMLGALAAAPAEEHGAAGLDHLVSHAVFKALLFLGAGWLAAIGGCTAFALLRGRMKGWGVLPVSFGLGLAALAGIPPTIGFVSKDGVVAAAREGTTTGAHIVLYATYLTVFLTAMYATRAYLVLVSGDPEKPDHHDDSHTPPPTGASYTLVAGVIGTLGLLSLVGGAAFLVQGAHIDPTVAAVSVGIALLGVLVSWALSRRPGGDPATVLPQAWARATQVNLGTDRVYAGFAAGVVALARVVVRLDNAVVDALPRGLASGATALGDHQVHHLRREHPLQ